MVTDRQTYRPTDQVTHGFASKKKRNPSESGFVKTGRNSDWVKQNDLIGLTECGFGTDGAQNPHSTGAE